MRIIDLASCEKVVRDQAATLLVEYFDSEPKPWPTTGAASEEIARILRDGFARGALEGELLLGWIGGLADYDGRVCELHPVVTRRDFRRRGVGRALVGALEAEAARRGALTVTLGTDDVAGETSLSGVDLYTNVARHIAETRDLGRGHPFLFYLSLGYVITGVLPDANGLGKPDIFMSKRVGVSTQ